MLFRKELAERGEEKQERSEKEVCVRERRTMKTRRNSSMRERRMGRKGKKKHKKK